VCDAVGLSGGNGGSSSAIEHDAISPYGFAGTTLVIAPSMPLPPQPHDALFRSLLEKPERAAALIRSHLPAEIAARLSEAPPRLLDGSFIDPELRESRTDRLFQVALCNGRPAFLYVLVEHKSRPDPGTPLQLLGYMVRIWQRHAGRAAGALVRLPPIIPLVFYHGPRPWTLPDSVLACIDADADLLPFLTGFRYILRNLGSMDYDALAADAAVRAVLGALKFAFASDVRRDLLARLIADLPDGDSLEIQVLRYIVRVYDTNTAEIDAALDLAKPSRKDTLMPTVAEVWTKEALEKGILQGREHGLAEGRRHGLAEGRRHGLAEGKAESLLRLMRRRFGPLAAAVEEQVRRADEATLDGWIEGVLDAPTADALLGAPPSH